MQSWFPAGSLRAVRHFANDPVASRRVDGVVPRALEACRCSLGLGSVGACRKPSGLAPLRKADWLAYAKPPFGGPETMLAYLSRYSHRVAISNHRLVSTDAGTVGFRWKDYRIKRGDRMKVMRLPTSEFIRRFLRRTRRLRPQP